MSAIWSSLDKFLLFIGFETSTYLGRINFVGFLITIAVIKSPKISSFFVKPLEWIAYWITKKCFDNKIKPPSYSSATTPDKSDLKLYLMVFGSLVICIGFVAALKQ